MADLGEDSVKIKPPIIMKVDAPPEDNNTITSQGGSLNSNLEQSDSVKTPMKLKKPVLTTSRLNNSNNPFTIRSSVLNNPKLNSGVVLRPSALSTRLENSKSTENNKNTFALCPSRLNPFAKVDHLDENCMTSDKSDTNNGTEALKFVPLVVTEASTKTNATIPVSTTSVASTSNFVFGQNLHERVVSESEEVASSSSVSNCSTAVTSANGTSELLFSSAAQKTIATDIKEVKSLTESAREYEESRANKRKYETVTVVTGEEDEQNILQINCKLFAFDKTSGNWQERGRGTLRLNDKEITDPTICNHSRLVFRTAGSLRVVLNTKIWAEMTVDRASGKSLRLTAMDATGQIKVFLIMAGSEEINQLQRLLEARVKQLKDAADEPRNKKAALQ